MSSLPSVGAVTETSSTKDEMEVSSSVTVHSLRSICFALRLRPVLFFFLPLVVFFIKGFSLGGMKALFRSSCFFVSASACFTWERGTVTVTFLEYHSYSSWVHLCSILQKLYSYRKILILLLELTCANQAINEWNCNQAIEEKKGDKCFLLAWRHPDFFTVRSVMSRHLSPAGDESTLCSPWPPPSSSSFSHFHAGRILRLPAPCQPKRDDPPSLNQC